MLFPFIIMISPVNAETYIFSAKWGTPGSGPGQFNNPRNVAVDSSGNLYVVDTGNARVQKLDATGSPIWVSGSLGSSLYGVALDGSGTLYVTDTYSSSINALSSTTGMTLWTRSYLGYELFPVGVAVDNSGSSLYVTDSSNDDVAKISIATGAVLDSWGGLGSGDGQFDNPWGVSVDASGNVYVVDSFNRRVQKFDSSGNFLGKWGSTGLGDGQFMYPVGVAVDVSGNVYVSDVNSSRLQKFDAAGIFLAKWGSYGDGNGQFNGPYGVAVDDSGNVYVADSGNNRIQEFRLAGVTINNVVEGIPPDSAWNYLIVDSGTGNVVKNFTLPAAGGSVSFSDPVFLSGGTFVVTETPKFGYYTDTSAEQHDGVSSSVIYDSTTAILYLAPDGSMTVTFTNAAMPAFAFASVGEAPPSDLNFNIPPLTPIPVQAGWSVDINDPPNEMDLVLGKATALLVNVSETATQIEANDIVTVTVEFEGNTYTNVTWGHQILSDSVISMWNAAITPPSTSGPSRQITGTYTIAWDESAVVRDLIPTSYAVKETPDLLLYFDYMTRSNSIYGRESSAAYYPTLGNSTIFINATYPVKNVAVDYLYANKGITGADRGPLLVDPDRGMRLDCIAVATRAATRLGASAVGIAIAPNVTTATQDYFKYHRHPGAAGVSFGPNTKGVVVLDGYYTAAAHEVAHTYALYWAMPEQYQTDPPNGKSASGIWAQNSQWRTGYDFMGLAPYKTLNFTWVNDKSSYRYLFNHTATNIADPEILVANGIIYKNGTVELPFDWYHIQEGTPDTLVPGDYALRFADAENNTLATTSFDASFFMQIDPGTGVGDNAADLSDFGKVETDAAAFAFSTVYPEGTAAVELIDNTDPENPVVMTTVPAANIKEAYPGQPPFEHVIPEVPLGPIMAAVSMLVAFGAYVRIRRRKIQSAHKPLLITFIYR
jgi:DNA-binding beta-propeller fold protein YncE